jgi:diaminopimelate epimerase
MRVPFTKAHGARNDFLLTWSHEAPREDQRCFAQSICDRNCGVGADGWIVVTPPPAAPAGTDAAIRLYNSDGSDSEISGNGTRCAAAFLLDSGVASGELRLQTGAGVKPVRLIERSGLRFLFEMNMGRPSHAADQLRFPLPLEEGTREVTILNMGNPQCVVMVRDFDFDWRDMGRRIESHPQFPERTNVSFVRVLDDHTLDVLFWERGAGETKSSGTGSAGAVAAAILRGEAKSPVAVRTQGGNLSLRWEGDICLCGPAEIIAGGVFYWERE